MPKTVMPTKQGSSPRPWPPSGAGLAITLFGTTTTTFIKAGLNYITTHLVTANLNPDGWPEGAGMVEATGMGAIKLDVAVYTIRALNDLAEMADSKGDNSTRDWAAKKASELTKIFTLDWWIPSQGLFADSLALNQMVPTDPLATLEPWD
jgi:hypothetical protein